MEGYINLFDNNYSEGSNRPHFKGFLKIDGIEHEFALWPNREGKSGYSGKYKPKQPKEPVSNVTQSDADKVWEQAQQALQPKKESVAINTLLDDEIPFD